MFSLGITTQAMGWSIHRKSGMRCVDLKYLIPISTNIRVCSTIDIASHTIGWCSIVHWNILLDSLTRSAISSGINIVTISKESPSRRIHQHILPLLFDRVSVSIAT